MARWGISSRSRWTLKKQKSCFHANVLHNREQKNKGWKIQWRENTRSWTVSKYMISLKFPLRSQVLINNCINHYKSKTKLDIWWLTPPPPPTTYMHSFLLNMKSAEIWGTLKELVTFRGIYTHYAWIFLVVTKRCYPCSVDKDTEVKEYTESPWILVTIRLLRTLILKNSKLKWPKFWSKRKPIGPVTVLWEAVTEGLLWVSSSKDLRELWTIFIF